MYNFFYDDDYGSEVADVSATIKGVDREIRDTQKEIRRKKGKGKKRKKIEKLERKVKKLKRERKRLKKLLEKLRFEYEHKSVAPFWYSSVERSIPKFFDLAAVVVQSRAATKQSEYKYGHKRRAKGA